ncbi:hypothetical protein [Methylomonas albis]|uniref:Peptidoglycan-binding protein n=1 Tax=Methylomonas albis TaxID=1854563 RepID=A0ABR9D0V1_9GAMM|nr:peptidoglycan-binding domain-containing protein [Methylomonas albis]MBD9356761.1 peptidoglycan-binding protein [Methylomonas albis]CAD6879911.1 hypothetical protein [Methylomonas albis]
MYIYSARAIDQPATLNIGELYSPGLAQPPNAANPVKRFTCSQQEREKIEQIVGKPVSTADARIALRGAAEKAVVLTYRAARALEKLPRSTRTRTLFREVFATFPELVPKWRTADAIWKDLGALVALRLRRAAGLLAGGRIHYHCWGCPGGERAPTSYEACNFPVGSYVIGLGKGFWENMGDARADDLMAMTLLHEALHIYYSAVIGSNHDGRYGNAYCYQRFVPEINGLNLYPETEKACPSVLRRGARGNEVGKLQALLNRWIQPSVVTMALLDKPPVLTVNQIFDQPTEIAVQAFQKAERLTPNGVADSETWRKLLTQRP